jgi:hypothetical protein
MIEFHHSMPFGNLVLCGMDTPLKSYIRLRPRLSMAQRRVLEAVRVLGEAAPWEVTEYLGWQGGHRQSVERRMRKLAEMNLIAAVPKPPRTCPKTGRRGKVWRPRG